MVVYQEKCKYKQTADHFLFLSTRKKLSNFSHSSNWKSASNYVAKRYMQSVDRNVYFDDVRLQMEAKLWGEEYNRHRPPKQVEQADPPLTTEIGTTGGFPFQILDSSHLAIACVRWQIYI